MAGNCWPPPIGTRSRGRFRHRSHRRTSGTGRRGDRALARGHLAAYPGLDPALLAGLVALGGEGDLPMGDDAHRLALADDVAAATNTMWHAGGMRPTWARSVGPWGP
jgi:hypothetical protein